MEKNKYDIYLNKILTLKAPDFEGIVHLEQYDIKEIFKDGIEILDEFYSLSDITSLEFDELIDDFIYICSRYRNDFLPLNLLNDNLTIFLTSRYNDKISNEFLVERIYSFVDDSNFKNYINNNKERLREYFANNGKIRIPSFGRNINVLYFYNEFKDVLKLNGKEWDLLFQKLPDNQLYDLILIALENDDEFSKRILNSDVVSNLVSDSFRTHMFDFDVYLKLLKKSIPIKITDNFLVYELIQRESSIHYLDKYFYKLGILRKISKLERSEHSYYQECYDTFFDVMKNRIKDLTDEDNYIIEELFGRIIDGESFLLITSINNKGSLLLYYKTNIFFKNVNELSAESIDKISLEQWLYIKKNYENVLSGELLELLFPTEINLLASYIRMDEQLIELSVTFGFDFMKFLLEKRNYCKDDVNSFIISGLKKLLELGMLKDINYTEDLKNFIIEFLNDENMHIQSLNNYMGIFTYLYKKNYPNLSFNTFKSLVSIDNRLNYIVNSNKASKIIYKCLDKEFDSIFDEYLEFFKSNRLNTINHTTFELQEFTNIEFMLLELFDREISSEIFGVTNDCGYFNKLDALRKMTKKERESHTYFYECYEIYFNIMKTRIKDMTDDDVYMIKKLFNRIINGTSFFLITSIDNRASLLLYYKTNIYFRNLKKEISIEDINNLSSKQWMYIGDKFISNYDLKDAKVVSSRDSVNFPNCICSRDDLIEMACKLGFDFFDSFVFDKEIKSEVYARIMNEMYSLFRAGYLDDKKYVNKMKKFIIEFVNDSSNNLDNFKKFIDVFNYLYQNEYYKLTFHKVKQMSSDISSLLFPNNYHIKDNLDKLDFVAKGEPLIDKMKGIVLYNKYRKRIKSSIPNYKGNYSGLEFGTVDMHDVSIISNGIGKYIYPDGKRASSCLTPNGKAASCLEHGAINNNGRFFYVKKDGKIIAYSWMWRRGNVICFDNIEHTEDYLNVDNNEECLYNVYSKAARDIIDISRNIEEKPIKVVVLGRNPIDVENVYFDKLPSVNSRYDKLFKPLDGDKLYLRDSLSKQVLLYDSEDDISLDDVEPIYLVPRGNVEQLGYNMDKANAIYFDYCLENCIKYEPLLRNNFKRGYIGDDWFYGEKLDGTVVLYETLDDERRKEEIRRYTSIVNKEVCKVNISKSKMDRLNYLLDSSNYCCDVNELKNYLASLNTSFELSKKDFFHGTSLENYMKILIDNAISSAYTRKAERYGGNNGEFFVSVAKVNSTAYRSHRGSIGFLFGEDIMTFDTAYGNLICPDINMSFLSSSDYYIRPTGEDGECQVYGSIPLNKTKVVMVPGTDINMGQVIYLAEECDFNFPVVNTNTMKLVNNEEIKRLVRLK